VSAIKSDCALWRAGIENISTGLTIDDADVDTVIAVREDQVKKSPAIAKMLNALERVGATRVAAKRRPVYLLSGLIKCGACGGGFSKVSAQHYGCSNARNRGTCSNLLTIRRDVVEASVLSGLKTHLMHPDLVKEFVAEYHRELNRLNAAQDHAQALKKDELVRVERQIRALVDVIKDGIRTPTMKEELRALEARKVELAAAPEHAPAPRLRPKLAEIYRQKVANLQEELNRPELRAEAAEAIRSLIEEIRLVFENGRLEIELAGDLAGILALASGSKKPVSRGNGLQVTLVAGARYLLYRDRRRWVRGWRARAAG